MQRALNQIVLSRIRLVKKEPTESHKSDLEKTKINYEHQIYLLQSSVAKSQEEIHQLNLEMDKKLEEMRLAYLEFEDLRQEYRRLEEEASLAQIESQKNSDHKDALINEYQRTISEQRMIIEKRQRYIAKLEGKIQDLMHEIRSLLEEPSPKSVPKDRSLAPGHLKVSQTSPKTSFEGDAFEPFLPSGTSSNTSYDFSLQLHKHIEKAENLTGMDHLGYLGGKSPRFLDLSLDCYAVDRRRLFDSFKDESAGALFIYEPNEKKFLFINPSIKSMTGFTPEKFMKEYHRLVVKGYPEWVELISKLQVLKMSSVKISIYHKTGEPKPIDCYLGMLFKGPFAHHVLGLFTA